MARKLIVNMMCYNELYFLETCIKQLLEFCDGIIILDNGSTDGSVEYLEQIADQRITVIFDKQPIPMDYSLQRNKMLAVTPDDSWVLKWDPDELPSITMKKEIREYLDDIHSGWTVPIYHMMGDRHHCLAIEVGFGHLRLFKKNANTKFYGHIHEQVSIGDPYGGIHPESDIGVVHLSYYLPNRLHKKAVAYSKIEGSGFLNAKDLTSRLRSRPVPFNLEVDVSDEWLDNIRDMS